MTTSQRRGGEPSLVRMYLLVVTLVTLVTVAAGVFVALQRPLVYTARSEVQVLPVATRGAPIAPDMATERELALSGSVASRAAAVLNTSVRRAQAGLSVAAAADAAVLDFQYVADNPRQAFDGADAFVRSYVDIRNSRQKARAATVITRPGAPVASPDRSLGMILAVSLLAGLMLGFGCAWLWDRISNRVRSAGELARWGPPVLGASVSIPRDRVGITARGREGFVQLAGRIDAETRGRRAGARVLVTAPRGNSGASAVALNLAACLAGPGRGVVLADLNMAAVGISAVVAGSRRPGLLELLDGTSSVTESMRVLDVDNVRLIPSTFSKHPPRIDVGVAARLFARLARHDIVVIDGPPLLEAPEAMLLAGDVDVVLLVADLGKLSRADVARTVELLEPVAGPVVGWLTHDRLSTTAEPDIDVVGVAAPTASVPVAQVGPHPKMSGINGVSRVKQ